MLSSTPTVPRLTLLVDAHDDLALLPALAEAGVDGFQVRAKAATDAKHLLLARLVREAVAPLGATVTVDDRVDVAMVAGAGLATGDGVADGSGVGTGSTGGPT